jgi:triosephosphate isomerase
VNPCRGSTGAQCIASLSEQRTGDTGEEMEAGRTEEALSRQLAIGLNGIAKPSDVVVLYEPVWALGTGISPTGSQAGETIGFIRKQLAHKYGEKAARSVRIVYAGSVRRENAAEFITRPEIDGLALGTASLDADGFLDIVRTVSELYQPAAET